ncbi:MAG: DUF4382 domain-containing protein [Gemmatimonadetes bacterium]|nr:DUF4382 domain-containing protein [Gemmatimonadota bacterium]NIR79922.1 DUF4382 domain-containing protein [Gemmatimonadota bacterium]NIT88641.1 DUF4382 domain-containing protein [Gemmatimonadota bacterium]NIU32456.1 DUF4382 domain-containing protein [Gemmatimonadota bacterium]NIU36949.1 DUF4382 domain-containing protein [Gemmatimonadota bacterium]
MNETTHGRHLGRLLSGGALALSLILSVACGDGLGPNTARIQVRLTDAPSDSIASAEVWISRVYLAGRDTDQEEEPAGEVELFHDAENPRVYDLLTLQDGVTADVTDPVQVESGVYNQLRLVVDRARITLAEVDTDDDGEPDTQLTFQNGETSKDLFVPSGFETGIKVQLSGPIDAETGDTEIVLVDFDVDRNFVMQTDPPHGIRDILFTPTLVEQQRTDQQN